MSEVVESEQLKQIISKIEHIEEERQEISDQLKDTYNEAKALGFPLIAYLSPILTFFTHSLIVWRLTPMRSATATCFSPLFINFIATFLNDA